MSGLVVLPSPRQWQLRMENSTHSRLRAGDLCGTGRDLRCTRRQAASTGPTSGLDRRVHCHRGTAVPYARSHTVSLAAQEMEGSMQVHLAALGDTLTADVPALIGVSAVLFGLFIWRQLYLDKRAGHDAPPPLTPRRLFSGAKGQLIPIYISAVFIWINVDVSASDGRGACQEAILISPEPHRHSRILLLARPASQWPTVWASRRT